MIAGSEPPMQKLCVDVLLLALVIAVLGSMAGAWLTLTGRMTDPDLVYWFGHQGYEYLDMGRFWQFLIFRRSAYLAGIDGKMYCAGYSRRRGRQASSPPPADFINRYWPAVRRRFFL